MHIHFVSHNSAHVHLKQSFRFSGIKMTGQRSVCGEIYGPVLISNHLPANFKTLWIVMGLDRFGSFSELLESGLSVNVFCSFYSFRDHHFTQVVSYFWWDHFTKNFENISLYQRIDLFEMFEFYPKRFCLKIDLNWKDYSNLQALV